MKSGRFLSWGGLLGVALLVGIAPIAPVRAQEGSPEVHGRIVIKGPNGVQEFDVDPSQLPLPPGGGHLRIMGIGPDGQVFSYGGNADEQGRFIPFGAVNGSVGIGAMGGLNIIDPGRSYIHQLIKRNDVRSELLITAKQREAMDNADTQQQQTAQQTLQTLGATLQGKSPEELKTLIEEQTKQIQEQMKSLADAREKRLASILTPKQMARLLELDLQWRGPLALGVKPVADQVKLTQEQAPKAAALLQEYRQGIARQRNFGFQPVVLNQRPATGADPYAPPNTSSSSTPAERRAKMEAAQKEIEKARKTLGEKALKELTSEQRGQWDTLTGKPFRFRTND